MADREPWDLQRAPRQDGRTAVVTGANSGIGWETARALAGLGAHVVLACRNAERAAAAVRSIAEAVPGAGLSTVPLDTSDLSSVRAAAQRLRSDHERIDLLINNAGVAWPEQRLSVDGVELQLATNHLGHFALTGLLLDRLTAAPGARVVVLTSLSHRVGRLRPGALAPAVGVETARRRAFADYSRSKLAVLLFAHELQARLQRAGADTLVLSAHPGGARTELLRTSTGTLGPPPGLMRRLGQFQSAAMGALPTLRAALDPAAEPGGAYRPGGALELRGDPVPGETARRAHDPELQRGLWEASVALSGVDPGV